MEKTWTMTKRDTTTRTCLGNNRIQSREAISLSALIFSNISLLFAAICICIGDIVSHLLTTLVIFVSLNYTQSFKEKDTMRYERYVKILIITVAPIRGIYLQLK